MSEKKTCSRCGAPTPTIDNILDTQTYYGFQVKTETRTERRKTVRLIIWNIAGQWAKQPGIIRADEECPLCVDCGGLLVGRFMQGRSVDALPGKEGR